MAKPATTKTRRIAILVFDDVELLDIAGPHEVFATASALAAASPPFYEVQTVARKRGTVTSSSGLAFEAAVSAGELKSIDTLLIAGGAGTHALCEDVATVKWLKAMAPKVRRLGAICTGAFLLGAAGLLDGRRAVTLWNWCDRLAARHQGVKVERDPIYVSDKGVWTSAGVTAGIDMALAMIEEDHGAKLALRTAQELVVFRKRPGGQSQFSAELALTAAVSPSLETCRDYVLGHLAAVFLCAGLGRARRHEPAQFLAAVPDQCAIVAREVRRIGASRCGTAPARRDEDPVARIAILAALPAPTSWRGRCCASLA